MNKEQRAGEHSPALIIRGGEERMKIRKVEEKPMVLHTSEKPKLHIQKKKKPAQEKKANSIGNKAKIKSYIQTGRKGRADKKEKADTSVKVRNHRLHTMASVSIKKVSEQMDGGEEIRDSVELLSAAARPVQDVMGQGKQFYRKRKQRDQNRQNRRNSCVHSDTDHAQTSNKMRRRAAGRNKDIDRNTQKKSRKSGSGVRSFAGSQMLNSFLDKFTTEKEYEQGGLIEGTAKTAKAAVMMAVQAVMTALAPALLGLFAVVAMIGVIVVAVIAMIYNSPLSLFFPQPDTGYDSPRTVLSEYYKEFNDQIMKLEKEDYVITYQNTEDGAPVSNFNDTLMVYTVKYGTGQAGFVMDDEGKRNLKKVFDEMNYYDSSSSTAKIPAGASLGEVVTTGYCSCAICCGRWAGGHTASGTVPKGNHTLAVDAHNPKVPMGTKIVMNGHTYKVEDTGNFARYGTDFDIYFDTHAKAQAWGKRKVEAYLADGDENTVEVSMAGTLVHNLNYEDYIALDKLNRDQVRLLKEMMASDLWDSYYDVAGGGAVAELAMTKIGCRYSQERRYEEGYYDCSSLVQRLYKEAGIDLPATAATQGQYCYQNAMIINKKDLKPGDLIFYSYKENGEFRNISHVAIYVGDGKMVHAANEERGVVLDPLRTTHVVFYARPY